MSFLTKIHFTNNRTVEIHPDQLQDYVRFTSYGIQLNFKDGTQTIYPNIHVAAIDRIPIV